MNVQEFASTRTRVCATRTQSAILRSGILVHGFGRTKPAIVRESRADYRKVFNTKHEADIPFHPGVPEHYKTYGNVQVACRAEHAFEMLVCNSLQHSFGLFSPFCFSFGVACCKVPYNPYQDSPNTIMFQRFVFHL